MLDPDDAYTNIAEIFTQFGKFCQHRGRVNEANTRAQIIDRILIEALGWPKEFISREEPITNGYMDYLLHSDNRKYLIIEAKREGIPFDVPMTFSSRRRYKINGSIKTSPEIIKAVEQAQIYCVENAVRYAVVTNGYAWIIFRAYREDIPWRQGDMLIFPSAGDIKSNFIRFWNILSYPAILKGSLDEYFSHEITQVEESKRPIDFLRDPDASLSRNKYHMQLRPFIEGVFRDLGPGQHIDILEKCYVYNRSLRIIDDDFRLVIKDSLPRFLESQGTVETTATVFDAGVMGESITKHMQQGKQHILLLLGGIGAGKTTYINRFFHYTGKSFLDKNGIWFYVNFLAAPNENELESFINEEIIRQLRERYTHLNMESRPILLEAYSDKLKVLYDCIISAESLTDADRNARINEHLEKWIQDINEYVPRLIRMSRHIEKSVVICIDNVDQLSPEYQVKIFHHAHRISKQMNAVVVVALREESYHSASTKKAFTAYNTNPFHIASPPFLKLISLRLKYCRELLNLPEDDAVIKLGTGLSFNKEDVKNFLNIIEYSIFTHNKNIIRFIESLSFGNMREALDMFATFVYSGSTNVDKMLRIYDREGRYFVAFHEFAKSAILGDRRFYRDSASRILNLFERGQERNSSHFTRIRLLSLLLAHASDDSIEGRGFINIESVYSSFLDIFDNDSDLTKAISHLLVRQLIQVNTRSTDSLLGASHIRVSSAGWYYYKYLVRSFAYLDLVFQDTPIRDVSIASQMKKQIVDVDVLAETQDHMAERLSIRFRRVNSFLMYLLKQETLEYEKFNLVSMSGILSGKYMPDIIEQCKKEMRWIDRRIIENTERQSDDTLEFDENIKELDAMVDPDCQEDLFQE
jgi:hypothetical protein